MTEQTTASDRQAQLEQAIEQLRETGRLFYSRGWSVGTSSNYSTILSRDPLELLITASGKHKGNLQSDDFVCVDDHAKPTMSGQPKSSAETWLHVVAAQNTAVGAILHTHSVWATLLSDHYFDAGGFWIQGFEMLKGLERVKTHEHRQWIPIYENTQDIFELAERVKPEFENPTHPPFHGFLIRKHGLYTWGHDLLAARRHVEVFEFLFECVGRTIQFST